MGFRHPYLTVLLEMLHLWASLSTPAFSPREGGVHGEHAALLFQRLSCSSSPRGRWVEGWACHHGGSVPSAQTQSSFLHPPNGHRGFIWCTVWVKASAIAPPPLVCPRTKGCRWKGHARGRCGRCAWSGGLRAVAHEAPAWEPLVPSRGRKEKRKPKREGEVMGSIVGESPQVTQCDSGVI